MPPLTYVSGPYSSDHAAGVGDASHVYATLLRNGIPAFCPHLSHYVDIHHRIDYERWMWLDLLMVERCDVLVRLPGESPGADREVARAVELGLDVFHLDRMRLSTVVERLRERT